MDEQTKQTVEIARSLEQRGQPDAAVKAYLRIHAYEDAARVLVANGRAADAGHLLLTALGVGTSLFAGLDAERKKLAVKSAVCFAQGGDTKMAVEIYIGLGDPLRAAEVYERAGDPVAAARLRAGVEKAAGVSRGSSPGIGANPNRSGAHRMETSGHLEEALQSYIQLRLLGDAARVAHTMGRIADAAGLFEDAAMPYEAAVCFLKTGNTSRGLENLIRIPRDHPKYRAAAMRAIRLVSDGVAFDFNLEHFLSRFVSDGPRDDHEVEAFYVLAKLYRARDYVENAIDLLKRIVKIYPNYRDSAQLLSQLETETRGSPLLFEAIVKQDAAFRTPDRQRGRDEQPAAAPRKLDLPDLPDLPPLPTPGATSPVPSSRNVTPQPMPAIAPVPAVTPAVASVSAETVSASGGLVYLSVDALPSGMNVAKRYRIEDKVGQGGMAVVYRVTDLELDEVVAMKIFTERSDEKLLSRFRQELTLSRKLAHPNIVRLYDIGTHEGYKFITMELLDGQDLAGVLSGKPIELGRGLRYLIQACQGLASAHEQGIIHRDIKPENFFVTKSDVVKVMDFGIAKGKREGLTQAGFIAGTPAYMSPEQINNFGSVTHLSDIYALGIVAYEMFTGTLPFTGNELMQILRMHINDPPPLPRSRNPAIPDELEDVILRLLEKEPQKRIQSCRDLAAFLSELTPRPSRSLRP